VHQLSEAGAYIVTAGTYRKEHFFRSPDKLGFLQTRLFSLRRPTAGDSKRVHLFKHYHFIATSPDDASSLTGLISAPARR
jgi:hypothetical protein